MHPHELSFLLSISIVLVAVAFLFYCITSGFNFGTPSYSEPESIDDIAADEARLRAETLRDRALTERLDAQLKVVAARASLEDIQEIIKIERRR